MTSRRLAFALALLLLLLALAAAWMLAPQGPQLRRAALRTETPTPSAAPGWWDTPMPAYPVTPTPTIAPTPAP